MEECEALCNRITIMVNGSFRCIGTHKEIKDMYGAGRQLTVKLETPLKAEMADMQSAWSSIFSAAKDNQGSLGKNSKDLPQAWTGSQDLAPTLSRTQLAGWAEGKDPWLAALVRSRLGVAGLEVEDDEDAPVVVQL